MNKKYFTISVIKEARVDENRTPLTPNQIRQLIANFPNFNKGLGIFFVNLPILFPLPPQRIIIFVSLKSDFIKNVTYILLFSFKIKPISFKKFSFLGNEFCKIFSCIDL